MASSLDFNRIIQRSIAVSQLVQRTYREIAVDPRATGEAAIVVVAVAIASGIGGAANGFGGIVAGVISAFISWLLFAAVAWFFGTQLFGTPTTHGSRDGLIRTLGYAKAPALLNLLGFIPLIGWIFGTVAWVWVIITSLFAIRQVLGLSTGRAIITAIVAAIASGIIIGLVGIIFGIGFVLVGGM